ncbi:MAG: transcriptional regulatory protein [Alphaproteobacteria bacterium]|nr:transcriptional regulatory protein [Alphaproteobacteria bacterium]
MPKPSLPYPHTRRSRPHGPPALIKPKPDSPTPPASAAKRKRQSRQDLLPAARATIFNAAAHVVGELGYERASIKRITQAAGIAEGTFYLYFESRQSLFDQLLPHFGSDMLGFVARRIAGAADIFDMEERGFRAFFEFLKDNRWFFRVLIEAEVAAPLAYAEHFRLLADGYRRALTRAIERGEIREYDSEEIETVAYVLMAARHYLHIRYLHDAGPGAELPEKVVQTYLKLLRGGIH